MSTAAKLRLAELKKRKKAGGDAEALGDDKVFEVPKDQRPMHRLGMIPFVGKKVDTIDWAKEEIRQCNEILDSGRQALPGGVDTAHTGGNGYNHQSDASSAEVEQQQSLQQDQTAGKEGGGMLSKGKAMLGVGKKPTNNFPPLNSAFITFNRQIAAHLGKQALLHHEPYRMSGKYTEMHPEDVIWANLGMNPYEQKVGVCGV